MTKQLVQNLTFSSVQFSIYFRRQDNTNIVLTFMICLAGEMRISTRAATTPVFYIRLLRIQGGASSKAVAVEARTGVNLFYSGERAMLSAKLFILFQI